MTNAPEPRHGITARWMTAIERHRFDVLLCTLLLLLVSTPVVRLFAPERNPLAARLTVSALFVLTLLSAVFAVCRTRRSVTLGLSLVAPAILLHGVRLFADWEGVAVLEHVFSMCFLVYTIVVLLGYLFASERVGLNTIYASVCVYLLLGVLWANLYSLVNVIDPESFSFAFADGGSERMQFGSGSSVYPVYYSFVTLSTLGYGDIVPLSAAARMFAALEAVTGQLYLAVLVARLVGLHIAQASSAGRSDGRRQ